MHATSPSLEQVVAQIGLQNFPSIRVYILCCVALLQYINDRPIDLCLATVTQTCVQDIVRSDQLQLPYARKPLVSTKTHAKNAIKELKDNGINRCIQYSVHLSIPHQAMVSSLKAPSTCNDHDFCPANSLTSLICRIEETTSALRTFRI